MVYHSQPVRFSVRSAWCYRPGVAIDRNPALVFLHRQRALSFATMKQGYKMEMAIQQSAECLTRLALRACRQPLQALQKCLQPKPPSCQRESRMEELRSGRHSESAERGPIMLVYSHSILCSMPFLSLTQSKAKSMRRITDVGLIVHY